MNGGRLLTDHWIGGDAEVVPEEDRVEVLAPNDGSRICDVPLGSPMAVDAAVASAHLSDWWDVSARDRGRLLARLAALVDSKRVELAKLESLDTGKSVSDAEAIDLENAVRWLEYAAGWPKRIEGATLPVDGEVFAYTRREPAGLVAAITPWNYPLMLAVWKVAPALAAGCPVVLKPSERAPLSCLILGHLASEAGFPDGALNVVAGGPETGEALACHPAVAKVSFTGSQEVGLRVAGMAARRGKRCVTELGGKSAAILLPQGKSALRESVEAVVAGLVHNAGQACNAPSRLICSGSEEAALAAVGEALAKVGDFGPLIDGRALARVSGYVDRALDSEVEAVGSSAELEGGFRAQAMAFSVDDPDHELWTDEIFGPVLTVMASGDPVGRANDSGFDLAAGVFGDPHEATKMARRLRAGHVYVNCWSVQDPCAPFGGMGRSGVGREHGREGLDAFLRTKTIFVAD